MLQAICACAQLVPRYPAVAIGIRHNESCRRSVFELGAVDPTIAVCVHPGKSFGNPPLDSPGRRRGHLVLGHRAVPVEVHAQEAAIAAASSRLIPPSLLRSTRRIRRSMNRPWRRRD